MPGKPNMTTREVSTNRAPYYSDATVDGIGLLANNAVKTITPVDANNVKLVAAGVQIINGSGFTVSLTITTDKSYSGTTPDGEDMIIPLRVKSGETFTVRARILYILEKNTGGSTQTGDGVRYLFEIEPGS